MLVKNEYDSPETKSDFVESLHIPSGVIIQFTSFGGLKAIFADSKERVPLNKDITNCNIVLKGDNLFIEREGKVYKNIKGKVVRITKFDDKIVIRNKIDRVKLFSESEQVLLDIDSKFLKNKLQLR